ncbi:MAG: Fe-S protein assembly co-chaperone HscB [Proteobacteria bacterium]|nr:Fe-S protein assembly co-chaperone HscB [Pseudomonadota bacterium]
MIDFTRNHFELFGLPRAFAVDTDALESAYRALQHDTHPDRHAHAGDAERRAALQSSARVNEAYRTLRNPVERGRYLLALAGIDALDETDTSLPLPFLEAQLERREAADEAREAGDLPALDALVASIRAEARQREAALGVALDAGRLPEARGLVRELTFLQKVAADVEAIADALVDEAG